MTSKLFPASSPEDRKSTRNFWRLMGAIVGGIMIGILVLFGWLIIWVIAGDSPSSFWSKVPALTLVATWALVGLLLLLNYIFKKE